MPAPAVYQEDEFAAFMLQEIGRVGRDFGLTAIASDTNPSDYGDMTEPLNDVLLDYGEPDITQITGEANIKRLRALGAVHAWRAAKKRAVANYNMADGTMRLDRGAVFTMIDKQLAAAEQIAAAVGASTGNRLVVKVRPVRYVEDPYVSVNSDLAGG